MRDILAFGAILLITASGGALAANSAKTTAKAQPTVSARFAALDTNKDGFLSRAELKAGKANSYIRADTNHDGKVSLAELTRRMAPKPVRVAHAKVVKATHAAATPKRG
ncbi:MAG: EF-hand domain-containing protein [Sphingomicrobium sp.]